jgi:two-component sensor histidine kinase
VKNNLQQIASLLRLQMRHSEYKSLEEALNDVLSRILAIASVHDLLSREDLDHVGLRSIAETLVQHQQSSLIMPDKQITFKVTGADVHLNMTQATQVALVLNELILNAVEHGFNEAQAGEIHVNVEETDGEVAMWISNNGDKLPPAFDMAQHSHLGLQIVESLTRALGGKFSLNDVFGWTVGEVKFARRSAE